MIDQLSSKPATGRLGEIDSRVYPPLKIYAITQELRQSNVPIEAVLAGTGLTEQAVADSNTRTSTRQLIGVCANALRLSIGDPELPFRIGASLHVSSYTLFGYALLCVPDMRSVCRMGSKYHRLANPLVDVVWQENDVTGWWQLPPPTSSLMPAELVQFVLDIQFAVHATLHKDVMGANCLPIQAFVSRSAPAHAELYTKYLNCPVEFGAAHNELHYSTTWLDKPPQFANSMSATILADICDRLLAEIRISSGLVGSVYRELMRVPGLFPTASAVADALHMTSRTLLRKLKAENTTYNQILAEARHMLAVDYLRNTKLSVDDIAVTLGFASAAGFRHAFKRWSGKSPSDYRHR